MTFYILNPENSGDLAVMITRGEFVDGMRDNRVVPYKIYHPDINDLNTSQTFPLIVWSHGFGGNHNGASFLSRFLAKNGYIVFHPTHHGTDSSIWEGKKGHPWDILRNYKTPRKDTLARFYDVPFIMDEIEQASAEDFPLKPYIDFENIGMSGHSFGAMTTQVMAGMKVPDEAEKLIKIKDKRFKAGVLYSPVPIAHMSDAPFSELYGGIEMPMMHMTGTQDDSPIEGWGYEARLVIYEHAQSAEQYLLVKNEGDHMVYNGTRGKLKDNPYRDVHEQYIQSFALAFWDTYLKNSEQARAWLTGQGAQAYLGEGGTFEVRE